MNKQDLLFHLKSFGLSQPSVRLYDELLGLHDEDYDVDEAIRTYEPNSVEGDVFIPIVQGGISRYVYAVLGHAFHCRGYRPIFLTCRNGLGICMRKSYDENSGVCEVCHYDSQDLLSKFGFESWDIEQFLPKDLPSPDDVRSSSGTVYRGVDLEPFCKSSTRKHQRRYHLDLSSDPDRMVYEEYLRTGIRLAHASAEIIEKFDVQASIGGTTSYVYSGIPLEVSHSMGVPTYWTLPGKIKDKMRYNKYRGYSTVYDSDSLRYAITQNTPSPLQKQTVDDIMRSRHRGEGSQDVYSSLSDTHVEMDDSKTSLGVFTNLVWDASLRGTGQGLDDIFDWLRLTIENLNGRESVQVFIKTHPAEVSRETNERVDEWVDDHFTLMDNVAVIPPESEINTYNLIEDVDVVSVYNSTVGFEAAYQRTPVILAADTYYSGFGFTNDITSRDHYESMLSDLYKLDMNEEEVNLMYSFLHFFFKQKHLDFPFYTRDAESGKFLLQPAIHTDLKEGNEQFDLLVQRIVDGKPVYADFDG